MTYDDFVDEKWIDEPNRAIELSRATLGLVGEAGEIAEKVKKQLRGDDPSSFDPDLDLCYELGDTLFYLTKVAHMHGFKLQDVVDANIKKLDDRAQRGVLQGSGDNR